MIFGVEPGLEKESRKLWNYDSIVNFNIVDAFMATIKFSRLVTTFSQRLNDQRKVVGLDHRTGQVASIALTSDEPCVVLGCGREVNYPSGRPDGLPLGRACRCHCPELLLSTSQDRAPPLTKIDYLEQRE
ncbi:uncharacterized protein CLUP02_05660 [Colletotrichum lupini]|uniref:Uncharacterized protein n=1 Tax=Colletotrichum lupini TaxID=145971 RepID=A0A9Q8SN72_9PEZI|nr:uncharacterized protein CLUP02_05660 [Colletotrichum lupini]UQC80178.1 hypothetical protein CLUP02_05660 [Colletotrichum lupini]